jgi:hypothetical protein
MNEPFSKVRTQPTAEAHSWPPGDTLVAGVMISLNEGRNRTAIRGANPQKTCDAFSVTRLLWSMGRALVLWQDIDRLWRTRQCRFTDVAVKGYPLVHGRECSIRGELQHFDSPDPEHWLEKRNRYSAAEALIAA